MIIFNAFPSDLFYKFIRMKKNIPNFITMLNLLSGILSIAAVYEGSYEWAVYFIGFSAIFDFLDGAVARILKLNSEFGKQLDSLADLISFGLAPGFIMFFLLKSSSLLPELNLAGHNITPYFAFLIPIFSAWRLAKFNIDTRQAEQFIGLPTPAGAIIISSLALINQNLYGATGWMVDLSFNAIFLLAITLITSILLVTEIPLLSLKFKHLKWKGNQSRFALILISIILIIWLQISAIPLILISYISISLVFRK